MDFQDLQETAELAHLNMESGELKNAFPAFEEMIGFFAAMDSADKDSEAFTAPIIAHTEGMAASSRLVDAAYFRADNAPGKAAADANHEILEKAGERDGRFIVIPNVL